MATRENCLQTRYAKTRFNGILGFFLPFFQNLGKEMQDQRHRRPVQWTLKSFRLIVSSLPFKGEVQILDFVDRYQ